MKTIKQFAELVESQQKERYLKDYPNIRNPETTYKTTVKLGKKYAKVDVGTSGKFMIDQEGNIFGIKAYGVIHKGHFYGNLRTIDNYYWGEYNPVKL